MSKKEDMFFGATSIIFEKAKLLRKNLTKHEQILWEELRANKLLGLRFKAQHPIDQYIVDFYCHKVKLVVEIDGDSHSRSEQKEYDEGRTYDLNQFEITVLRFTHEEIETGLSNVLERIELECNHALSPLQGRPAQGVGGKRQGHE